MKLPLVLPCVPHAKPAWSSRHPNETRYVGRSVALSVALHLLIAAGTVLGADGLQDLIRRSSSVAESGSPTEQTMTLSLVRAETTPTPITKPTSPPAPPLDALPALPLLPLKSIAPALSPAIGPSQSKSAIAATVNRKPKHAASPAIGEGKAPAISAAHIGSPGLPAPTYPSDALALREGGTVGMKVVFRQDGTVKTAEVQRSSGFSILDLSTRAFIYAHWRDASLASTTIRVPIIYDAGM